MTDKSTFPSVQLCVGKIFVIFAASDSFLRPFRISRFLEEFYGGAKCVDRSVDVSAYN